MQFCTSMIPYTKFYIRNFLPKQKRAHHFNQPTQKTSLSPPKNNISHTQTLNLYTTSTSQFPVFQPPRGNHTVAVASHRLPRDGTPSRLGQDGAARERCGRSTEQRTSQVVLPFCVLFPQTFSRCFFFQNCLGFFSLTGGEVGSVFFLAFKFKS